MGGSREHTSAVNNRAQDAILPYIDHVLRLPDDELRLSAR